MHSRRAHTNHAAITGMPDIKAFGFWIYLMSDLVLFSILFSTFAVVGHTYAGGPTPKELFRIPYLFTETVLLLTSSATMGISTYGMYQRSGKLILTGLVLTFLLGAAFVIMEVREFYGMILEGNGPDRSSFLSSFFTLVGMHGAHVTSGLIWIVVMMVQVRMKGVVKGVISRLYRLGLFWHFLDLIWIGVFTVVYLFGVV